MNSDAVMTVHESHDMTEWADQIVSMPGFGKRRKCKACGGEHVKSVRTESQDDKLQRACVAAPSDATPAEVSKCSPGEPAPPPSTPAQHYLEAVNGCASQDWQDGFNVAYAQHRSGEVDRLTAELAEARMDAALGDLVWRFIDRMSDVCEMDTADMILRDFVASAQPIIDQAIAAEAGRDNAKG
jgi:hypothetical protein